MANDENKIILEFPATNVEIEFDETITFDNISGFLNSDRVTYNGESLTEEIAHLEDDKAEKTYVDTELAKKADKSNTYTKSEVDTLIDNLPEPMIFKGTLGVGGTIQSLPTASASNEGWTYKVITDGTYAGQTAKVGDVFTSNGSAWVLIPSGDEDNDTWRAIKVEGDEVLGNGISSGAVDFVGSENIEVEFDGNGNKVGVKTKNIYTKEQVDDIIYGILPDDTASGSVANFTTSLKLPIKSLEVDVNAVQEAGTPTPALPLPISGWNEIKISQVGKNLLSINDVVFEQFEERSLQNPIPSGNYVFSGVFTSTDTDATLCSVVFVDKDNNTIIAKSLSRDIRTSISLDLSKDCYKIRFYASTSWPASSGDTGSFSDLQIELGSIATEYEPYNANSELISLGGTYYGGHFTQDKAGHRQFEVTHKDFAFTGSESWQTSTTFFYLPAGTLDDIPIQSPSICSNGMSVTPMTNRQIRIYPSSGINSQYISMSSTVPELQGYLSNGIQFLYELATPIIIDLPDGEPIITLNGTNNIYADTGDTSVVFKCSVNDYINAHQSSGAKSLGGVFLGGSNIGSEEEPTEESEDTKKVKLDETKVEINAIGDMKKLGGE